MVKRVIVSGVGIVGLGVMSMALFGTGVAAADDYAGETYSDASSALSGASEKGVIAGVVGDSVSQGDCVVTRSQKAPWLRATTSLR